MQLDAGNKLNWVVGIIRKFVTCMLSNSISFIILALTGFMICWKNANLHNW